MKDLFGLNELRFRHPIGGNGDSKNGCFLIPCPITGRDLTVIASNGMGWDHVSVSTPKNCPSWVEMDYIKRMFFEPDECALQYHVPERDHINIHPNCLHLWRPHNEKIPMPDKEMVG